MNPNNRNKAISQQYNADAKLHSEFEQSGNSGEPFDYSKSVTDAPEKPVPDEQVVAYLSKIQRGGFIQSFGFLLAIEETSFKIIAHSENSIDLLGGLNNLVESEQLECLIGLDARTFFTQTSGVSLTNVVESSDMSLLNPVWVCSIAQKQFHAILHRIDVGILIDFEPVQMGGDIGFSVSGAVQSQKLAVGAISRLQVLTSGDIGVLCDAVVEEIQKLTGYDRVMVYKFHKDEHGEVVSEVRKPGLEPYLGLHYPATDIPQAARFQFKQNQVRMIVDCIDSPIRIIQSEDLEKPLILTKSTLRSPHPCHAVYMENMGSIASLVMAIVVNDGSDTTKLWGLVACHHCSARYIAYPLRYACHFVMQIFGLQLSMKIRLESQLIERKKFKIQTLLCDLLSKDVPFGVVTQTPNIMDLVKCDGAALCYNGKIHLLGVTPTEEQIKDIVDWLISYDGGATGLSTDSLSEAGYPGAALICDVVCGLASARIKLNDFLLWFRSQTAKEIKWGGAKHHSEDKDDGEIMHPRSSFKVFLEVVKDRSFPWEVSEINSIHSLQLIVRDLFQNIEDNSAMTMMVHAEQSDSDLNMSIFRSVASEMVRLMETARAPVLAVDSAGIINGWNAKIAELTGLLVSEAMGKSLVHELIHEESRVIVQNRLSRALQGEEEKNIELRLRTFGEKQNNGDVYIVANASISKDYTNNIIGLCFVGQDVTKEKVLIDKFIQLEGDYKAIVQCLNPLIPPIFASDENACCSEWNKAMEKLTGWTRGEVIGKTLPGVIFGRYCRLKDQDAVTKFMIFLYCTLCNEDSGNFTFVFYDRNEKYVEAILTANKKTNGNGHVIGCVCFLQTALPDKEALDVQAQQEQLKKLAYLRQEIEKPLKGIQFMTQKLVKATTDRDDQKQFLHIRDECEGEIMSLIENIDLGSIE